MLKLWIPIILVVWCAGMFSSNTFSGFIHLLPLLALGLLVLKFTGEHPTRAGDQAPRMKGSNDFRLKL